MFSWWNYKSCLHILTLNVNLSSFIFFCCSWFEMRLGLVKVIKRSTKNLRKILGKQYSICLALICRRQLCGCHRSVYIITTFSLDTYRNVPLHSYEDKYIDKKVTIISIYVYGTEDKKFIWCSFHFIIAICFSVSFCMFNRRTLFHRCTRAYTSAAMRPCTHTGKQNISSYKP